MPKNADTENVVKLVEDTTPASTSRIAKLKSLAKDPFVIVTAAGAAALVAIVVIANRLPDPDAVVTPEMIAEDEAITTY